MAFATRRHRHCRFAQRFELRDFDAEFIRTSNQVFPSECPRPLRGELVAHPHRVVAVQQDEMPADRKFDEGFDDQWMFDGAVEFATSITLSAPM